MMLHVGNSWFNTTPTVIPVRRAGMKSMTRSKSTRDLSTDGCFRLMLYRIDTREPAAITAAGEGCGSVKGVEKACREKGNTKPLIEEPIAGAELQRTHDCNHYENITHANFFAMDSIGSTDLSSASFRF